MSRLVLFLLPLLLTACAASDFTTSSSGPRKAQAPDVVVVEMDPEEVRAAQLRKQRREIEELRDALDANLARADAAAARSNAASLQAQSAIRALESELAQVKVRTDAAAAQSDKAFAIATEFLSNMIAAREGQSAIVERNISMFDRMEQRLAAIEGHMLDTGKLGQAELAATRARSSDMEQRLKDTDQELSGVREQLLQLRRNDEATRKQGQAELAARRARSSDMEQRLKDADQELLELREQLQLLRRNNEETRAAIDSGPMLNMLRQLEGAQRDTSGLRGAFEEMQQEQEAARKSMQNYYLDLDARIQDLQDRARAAREAEARLFDGDDESIATPDFSNDVVDMPATDDKVTVDKATVDAERSASDVLEQPDQIEALPLPEEISPESSLNAESSIMEFDASTSPGEATYDDAVFDETIPEENLLQADPGQRDPDWIDRPAGDDISDLPDALPDIVDTIDVMPGESSLRNETVLEAEDAVQQSMEEDSLEENKLAPDDQAPIDQDRESSTRLPVEGHAVIVTDWTLDAKARITPENRSPR